VYILSLRSSSPNLPTSRPDANRGGRDAEGLSVLPERCEEGRDLLDDAVREGHGRHLAAALDDHQEAPGELLICDPGN